jgi:hypothetical protein
MASTGTAARAPRRPQPARPDPNRAETERRCAQKWRLSPSYLGVPRWTGPGRNDTFANSRRQSRRSACVGPGWGVLHIQRRITREGVGGPAQTRPSHGPKHIPSSPPVASVKPPEAAEHGEKYQTSVAAAWRAASAASNSRIVDTTTPSLRLAESGHLDDFPAVTLAGSAEPSASAWPTSLASTCSPRPSDLSNPRGAILLNNQSITARVTSTTMPATHWRPLMNRDDTDVVEAGAGRASSREHRALCMPAPPKHRWWPGAPRQGRPLKKWRGKFWRPTVRPRAMHPAADPIADSPRGLGLSRRTRAGTKQ